MDRINWEKIQKIRMKVKRAITVRTVLASLLFVCLLLSGIRYFKSESAVSWTSIGGALVVPFQKGANEIGRFLFLEKEEKQTLREANERIRELEAENRELKRKNETLSSLAMENAELRSLLQAREKLSDYSCKAATVIGNSGSRLFSRFTINLGSRDGMKEKMNVINEKGLVGIITFVGYNYSIVTSIIEEGTNLSVMTKISHRNFMLTSRFGENDEGSFIMKNLSSDFDFETDSSVVTSTISDRYLPELPVGYVKDISVDSDSQIPSGTVETAVDFSDLKEVIVILTLREELED